MCQDLKASAEASQAAMAVGAVTETAWWMMVSETALVTGKSVVDASID